LTTFYDNVLTIWWYN